MNTYQDLIKLGENESNRAKFCYSTVTEFMSSSEYRLAKAGQAYYDKHNITIEKYKKLIFTVTGRQIEDVTGANYKLESNIFRRLCIQQVQYVLGNGLILTNDKGDKVDKNQLGKDIDFKLQKVAKMAMAQGKAFGFWNLDHLEVFGYADTPREPGFCPLYDEETAEVRAGIRYWFKTVDNKTLFRATLYEEDGYTSYSILNNEEPQIVEPKRAYKLTEKASKLLGIEETIGENYGRLPIVAIYSNDTYESELSDSIRGKIDAYDFIESGLANTIDDTSGFYWLVQNAGGMDDKDLAQLVQRIKRLKVADVDSESGGNIEAKTFDIPFQARQFMLEQLRKDIYEDFQALDVNTLSASAKTTQEIKASYQAQDNKCADFEYFIIEFMQKVLELAGVDANPTFVWNKVVNQLEQTQMVLQASTYLTQEAVLKHLPFLTPEEVDQMLLQTDLEEIDRFTGGKSDEIDAENNEDEENTDEEKKEA